MYFPYDYIYPEQHSYMVELKRTLDAKAGHLGEGGRKGGREGGRDTVTISGGVLNASADACMMVVCTMFHVSWCVMPLYAPNMLWMQGVYHSTIQATDSCASLHNHV